MYFYTAETQRTFIAFSIFGLLNNILYVVILSAAVDLVGSSTPKAIVLLSDIVPSLTIKMLAPFFIHKLPYNFRIWALVALSSIGMTVVSLSNPESIAKMILGITMASLSSGMGEVSFLQLTHYYPEKYSIGGFSMGTGGAGLLGSFAFLLLTNVIGLPTWLTLLSFAAVPFGFLIAFYVILPSPLLDMNYIPIEQQELDASSGEDHSRNAIFISESTLANVRFANKSKRLFLHIKTTLWEIRPLVMPYMLPLCTVYVAEYVINQGIAPTLLFPLTDLPEWLFSSYRDIYVVYGFLYQLGVFISRSSVTFGFRVKRLYLLSMLQTLNVVITVLQSIYDFPFPKIWFLLLLIFYEGLLGGLLYVNTFMSVSEQSPKDRREFSMGCVGISDSFGVMLAGCINWWLEMRLCQLQVDRGRDWCRTGGDVHRHLR